MKQVLTVQSADVASKLDKSNKFMDSLTGLLNWVDEAVGRLDELIIRDPNSVPLETQHQKCQVLKLSVCVGVPVQGGLSRVTVSDNPEYVASYSSVKSSSQVHQPSGGPCHLYRHSVCYYSHACTYFLFVGDVDGNVFKPSPCK